MVARAALRDPVARLDPGERKRLRHAGVTIGALDLFDARLLRPGPARWARALTAAQTGVPCAVPAPDGATVLPRAGAPAGFRALGVQAVRVDLVERIAKAAHEAREGRRAFVPDPALATSMGLQPATVERLMAELGFRAAKPEGWAWRGRAPVRAVPVAAPRGAFAALAELTLG